jgi:hypothetical protein
MIISLIWLVAITGVEASPIIYCNQTQQLTSYLQLCNKNGNYPNCSMGYRNCMHHSLSVTLQSQATNDCMDECTMTDCDLANCTQLCCDKAYCLIPGLQGAGIPNGCKFIDDYLTLKIIIITALLFVMVGSIVIGVKCFGKQPQDLTVTKIIQHYHHSIVP